MCICTRNLNIQLSGSIIYEDIFESIELNINDNLIMYLSNGEESRADNG